MNDTTVLFLAGIVVVSVIIQRISGFGFGVFALPIFTIALGARTAIPSMQILSISVAFSGAWRFRRTIGWGRLRGMVVPSSVGIGAGLLVLHVASERGLEFVIGSLAIVASVALSLRPRAVKHEEAGLLVVGALCGALSMTTSLAGPPFALFAYNQGWNSDEIRGTLFFYFGTISVVTFAIRFAMASVNGTDGLIAALLIPAVLVGDLVSRPVVRKVHGSAARVIAAAIVFLSGAAGVLGAADLVAILAR